MESVEATKKKVATIEEKATFDKMMVYEAKERASDVEQAFQQVKSCTDIVMKVVMIR